MHLDCQTLEVQQDLDDIFLDAFNGAVLMQNAIDFRLYHGTTGHGREQNAPQRIAQGMTEATLQRLKSDLGTRGRGFLNGDMTWSKKLGNRMLHERHLLLTIAYLEQSPPIRSSLMPAYRSLRAGRLFKTPPYVAAAPGTPPAGPRPAARCSA